MKKLFIILFASFSFVVFGQTTHYVSPTTASPAGNNANAGTIEAPWATLSYAISQVTTYGDIIHVNAGSYPAITTQMHLTNGVTITGAGRDVTTIVMTYGAGTPCIKLETWAGWENKSTVGHQSISGIKFVGSNTPGSPVGRCAIGVNFRNYVEIYDCEFVDFLYQAVWFFGEPTYNNWTINNPYEGRSGVDSEYLPFSDSFCTGNKFYNNIVHNSCGVISGSMYSGELEVATQDGILIYGNYMTATGRSSNQNGVPIKLIGDCGFNRNSKIYNNTVIAGHMSTNYWQFAMEIWWDLGGTEIYNNYCEGALDLCDSWDQYGAGWGIKCYDNEIGYSANTTNLDRGILFEGSHIETHVYNNHIHHVARGMTANTTNSSLNTIWDGVYVYNNIVHHLSGASWQTWGFLFDYDVTEQGGLWQDIYIQHNIYHASSTAPDPTAFGIMLPTADDFDNVHIENNILINWERGAIYGDKARDQATNIYIRNNLIYESYNNNDPYFTATFPTAGITYSGTVKSDPLFVSSSDFHLSSSSSPAYHAGIYVGISTDYDGVSWYNPPSIGAYEYTPIITTYYVRSDGINDAGRDGLTISTAWASLSYAAGRVPAGNNEIYIESGTYIDDSRAVLALGVNLRGNSTTRPNIITGYDTGTSQSDAYIYGNSSVGNAVDGSHEISYINFDGNLTGKRAMAFNFRSNVIIHHCDFVDFLYSGIRFYGTNYSDWTVTPTNTLPTGNKVYDCNFTNCTQLTDNSGAVGHIRIVGQNGVEIYDCVFDQRTRGGSEDTDIMAGYQNRGVKIHDNIWYKNDLNGTGWNFFVEFHYSNGGFEVYNNEFNGAACWDASGNEDKYDYGFGLNWHHNICQTASIPPIDNPGGESHNQAYLCLESFTVNNDVYVHHNYFRNSRMGVQYNNTQVSSDNVWIYSNIFDQVGNTYHSYNSAIKVEADWAGTTAVDFSNVHILNNTIYSSTVLSRAGIEVFCTGDINNMDVRNNIVSGNFTYSIIFGGRTGFTPVITDLNLTNNLTYVSGTDAMTYEGTVTFANRIDANNIINTNPQFTNESSSDFHLSSVSSPAYHTGVNVGLVDDYDGVAWYSTPSIGAYEFSGSSPSGVNHGILMHNGKIVMYNGKIVRY